MNLIRTAKGWIEPSPHHCPHGHDLASNALVGWQACTCGGHRTHTCKTCLAMVWTPELVDGCAAKNFDGR